MSRVFLGLGGNLGERDENIHKAVAQLPGVVKTSPMYETEPVGEGTEGQARYLNCVVEIQTELSPEQLLEEIHRIESDAGRVRRTKWEARTLDIDILLFDDLKIDTEELTVPHPRMRSRRFVLQPLADIAPELVDDAELASAEGEIWPWEPNTQ